MSPRQRGGNHRLAEFENELRLPNGFAARPPETGQGYSAAVSFLADDRPKAQNFWPALSLAFISQAEKLLADQQVDSVAEIFDSFPVAKDRKGMVVNTMNLTSPLAEYKLRGPYTAALTVITVEMRRVHPMTDAHATQAWRSYAPLVAAIYRGSPGERLAIAEWIWEHGVLNAAERRLATAVVRIVRPFEFVLAEMKTQGFRPGGTLFQALVFGYFRADSPNLTLESYPVNTGGSHAAMIGDVAGFRGGEVELAVEVKDHDVDGASVESVLGVFLEDLVDAPNATAVVVAHTLTPDARDQLAASNVIGLSRDELRERVITWDLPKQQEALRGAAYYLSRIQKSPRLLAVLEDFLLANKLDAHF